LAALAIAKGKHRSYVVRIYKGWPI